MSKIKKPHLKKSVSNESKPVMLLTLATVMLAVTLWPQNYTVKSLSFHTKVFNQKSSVAKKLKTNKKIT